MKIEARDVLKLIRANPGVSYHDLKRDLGIRCVRMAAALAKLGLVEIRSGKRGRTYWAREPKEPSSFGQVRKSDGERMKSVSKDNGSRKTGTAPMLLGKGRTKGDAEKTPDEMLRREAKDSSRVQEVVPSGGGSP